MKNTILFYIFLHIFIASNAQDSTQIELNEVTVSANIQSTELRQAARNVSIITAKQIAASPVKTIDGILQYALNVDVRTRSPFGVQTDIGIRGGHFDQTLILIDGIKMNDPQTGHHSMNLPLPIQLIEKIEVLQGGASRVFGPSAFSGVINIITKKDADETLRVGVGTGQFGLRQVNAFVGSMLNKLQVQTSVDYLKSDGYGYNTSFDKKSIYGKMTLDLNKILLAFQAGGMANNFGASNFYHPKFNDQYEQIKSQFLITSLSFNPTEKWQINANYSLRKHNDMYDFNKYRYGNLDLINFHETLVSDAEMKSVLLSNFGKTSVGIEFRTEDILSNRLGNALQTKVEVAGFFGSFYDKSMLRKTTSAFFEHQWKYKKWAVVGGTAYAYTTLFGGKWFPGVDISYESSKNTNLYASVNRSTRFPTFTELYLNTATVKADPLLKPETAWNYEVGQKLFLKNFSSVISVFYRSSETAIDKVKRPENAVPTMENIGDLHTFGFEFSGKLVSDFLRKIHINSLNVNYAYINANKEEDQFQSFYTLNFLRHKLSTGVEIKILPRINATIWYTVKKRAGTYQWDAQTLPQTYKTIHLVDTRLSYTKRHFLFFVDANNVLNHFYFEHGFVQQPARWISIGISVGW
jgi:vitamin B12 transporter